MQAEVGWFESAVVFMHVGIFGIAAGLVANTTIAEIDRITDCKTRHGRADDIYDTGTIAAQDGGKFVGVIGWLGAQLGIQRIDARGGQLDPYMVL